MVVLLRNINFSLFLKYFWGTLNPTLIAEARLTSEGNITSLPFVFAAWVSLSKLPDDFIDAFDQANEIGLHKIDDIVSQNPFDLFDLRKYYKLHLSYNLDERKRAGKELFLRYISEPTAV